MCAPGSTQLPRAGQQQFLCVQRSESGEASGQVQEAAACGWAEAGWGRQGCFTTKENSTSTWLPQPLRVQQDLLSYGCGCAAQLRCRTLKHQADLSHRNWPPASFSYRWQSLGVEMLSKGSTQWPRCRLQVLLEITGSACMGARTGELWPQPGPLLSDLKSLTVRFLQPYLRPVQPLGLPLLNEAPSPIARWKSPQPRMP